MPKLSYRLSVIASLVPKGARVCDIGTDHGYLAIELIKTATAKKVIATDVSEKPLNNARKNIERSNVPNIELRLGNGFSCITEAEVDTVIIAGMGGEVIADILKNGANKPKNPDTLILLQPTTSPESLRAFLYENGYNILNEIPILENSKLYSVLTVKYTGEKKVFSGFDCFIGKVTPETEAGLLYIKKQQKRCYQCMTALEHIERKQKEYLYYKQIFDEISEFGEK